MHYLYILYSNKLDQYYSGHSHDVDKRFEKHNSGKSRATHIGVPWKLKRVIEFPTKRQAIQAESWIKKMKSRKAIERVISGEIDLKAMIKSGKERLTRTPEKIVGGLLRLAFIRFGHPTD